MGSTTLTTESDTSDPQEIVKMGNTSDIRVGWINQLRKSELDLELKTFQLDVICTVEENRESLVHSLEMVGPTLLLPTDLLCLH